MKHTRITCLFLLITIVAATLWSCAPVKVKSGPFFKAGPGEELFRQAEEARQRNAFGKAIALYDQYLVRFPDGRHVPSALLKMGTVLSAKGDFAGARRLFERLLATFPDGPFQEEAHIGIMDAWYQEQAYQQVFDYADRLDDQTLSDAGVARKYALVGDSYLALGQPLDAAYVFISAMRRAGEDLQKRILIQLNQATRQMSPPELQALMAAIDDSDYRGYLSCQLGKRHMENGDYDRAMSVLSTYSSEFPGSGYARQAKKLIVSIDQQASYEHYAIGCLLPLSGKYQVFGEKALQGVQLAFQEFMTQHGAKNDNAQVPPIRLVIRDTGSDPQQAVKAVQDLAEQKVAVIIGPLEPFEEVVTEAQNYHIPIIAMTQKQHLPAIGTYVFRNFLTPKMQVKALAAHVCDDLGLKRVAVLYPDEAYGQVFANMFWDEILANGGIMVGFEGYDPGDTDFGEPIKRLIGQYYKVPDDLREIREQRLEMLGLNQPEAETTDIDLMNDSEEVGGVAEENQESDEAEEEPAIVDFDVLFIPDGPSNAGLILPQLAYYDVDGPVFLGTNLWHSQELIRMAKIYANGSLLPSGFWKESPAENVQSFVQTYAACFDEEPGVVAAVAYDTTNIVFAALLDNEPSYRSRIRNFFLSAKGFPGVTGFTSFDDTGEVQKILPLLEIHGRRFVHVSRAMNDQGR